jgi:hypothetical protein
MSRPDHSRARIPTLLVATLAVVALGGVALIACNPSPTPTPTTTTTRPTTTTTRPTTTTTKAPTTTTTTTPKATVDPTHLPVGDGKYSTSAKSGYVYSCQTTFNGGGASSKGPWFNSDGTWDSTKKGVVDGNVEWDSILNTSVSGGYRYFTGNDLPSHVTGKFPIAQSDTDVFPYDKNPNSISSQTLSVKVPANPTIASKPTCIRGELGIMLTGSALFSAFDAGGRDAVAWEAQDVCSGHPQAQGAYHYHSLSACISDPGTGQSNLLGYAYDGFGIYGMRGADGKELTNADLDECHGTTSPVMWDGKLVTMYHYVATREFPYVMGCFKGTPIQNQFSG